MLIESKYCLYNMKSLLGESSPAWEQDSNFLDIFFEISNHTLVSPVRLYNIYQYTKYANYLYGDFAQVGVLKGGSAKLISHIMRKNKTLHLFDTFTGLPDTNKTHDLYTEGKFNQTSEAQVRDLFKNTEKKVTINKGIFPYSATEEHINTTYAFVYLDVDIYQSNLEALEFFYPRLTQGGVILIDDYDWNNTPGIKSSIDEFITKEGLPQPIITTKYQCLIQKNQYIANEI